MGRELLQRIQVVQANQTALPHHCVVCTRYKGEFIDFGLDLEYFGVVYLCPECFKAIGFLAGLVSADDLEIAQKKIDHLQLVNEELEQKVDTYESVLDGLNFLRSRSSFDDPAELGNVAPTGEDSKGSNAVSSGIIGVGTVEISGSSESVDESGSRSLLDTDGIADLIDGI